MPEMSPCGQPGPLGTLILGLKVVWSELSWLAIKYLRRLEIRQLEKQLARERETLCRLAAPDPTRDTKAAAERDLAEKQVAFLKEEIDLLARELEDARRDYVARRLKTWGLDPE